MVGGDTGRKLWECLVRGECYKAVRRSEGR